MALSYAATACFYPNLSEYLHNATFSAVSELLNIHVYMIADKKFFKKTTQEVEMVTGVVLLRAL